MPVKKGAAHCSACGEAITAHLTGSLVSHGKQTTALDPQFDPYDAPAVPVSAPLPRSTPVPAPVQAHTVIVEEPMLPPTTSFARSNGEPMVVQTCLRCNSVLNPAAKFCS